MRDWIDATNQPIPDDEVPDDERMTAAELVVILGWLGLDQRALSVILEVNERTVRRWALGQTVIPDGVRIDIEHIEQEAASAVDEIVVALRDARDPTIDVYRNSESMWADRPGAKPYPASWWRMVAARAAHEVPGVAIEYRETNDRNAGDGA